MKSALTNTISEQIQYDYAGGAVSKPVIKTEYYSDTSSTWVEFDNDLEDRDITLSNENKRYQVYSFLPPSKQLKIILNNFNQVYATGSGDAKASILKKNLLIRCWSGYNIPSEYPSAKYGSAIYGMSRYSATGSSDDTDYFFKQGVFIIDDPIFSDTKVNIIGRDYLRKALETEINMPILSSVTVENAITQVLDRCSIPYDTGTWDHTSTTVSLNATLAEGIENESAWQILDYLMDAQNAGDDDWIFRFSEDGNPELKIVPTDSEADWTTHYKYNIESVSKSFDSDKQLQRVTAMNKDIPVNAETLLINTTGTSTGSININHAAALYVRYVDNLGGRITEETNRTNSNLVLSIPNGTTYDIDVYGCIPRNAITDEVWAESGNSDNILNNNGSTYKRINPFLNSNMCKEFSDYLISKYGDPRKTIKIEQNIMPLLELNDKVLVFDRYTYTDDIYIVNEIQENWSNPGLKQTIILRDSGVNLGEFIWDRNGLISGINDLKYDTGLVWDQDLTIGASDTNTYRKKVRFA